MGSLDKDGVENADLKVHGVQSLRIADASVVPIQPTAHIQTMVYDIAEIAARKIADEYQ